MITCIQTTAKGLSLQTPEVELFVFGSITRVISPHDIDLLVVYDRCYVSSQRALSIRKQLVRLLKVTGLPVEVILLSREENARSRFSAIEGAIPISLS